MAVIFLWFLLFLSQGETLLPHDGLERFVYGIKHELSLAILQLLGQRSNDEVVIHFELFIRIVSGL